MREFEITIEEALRNGLRPEKGTPRNAPYLRECLNMIPHEQGLEVYEKINVPISSEELQQNGIFYDHPFPQLFIGRDEILLVDNDRVFSVDENDWTLSQLPTYAPGDRSTPVSITGGGAWHYVDLGKAWFLFNGVDTVMKPNLQPYTQEQNVVLADDSITIGTGCYHRGRIVTGGFNENNFWSDDWQAVFYRWKYEFEKEVQLNFDIGSNYVLWSSIGGGDFPLWLWYPNLAIYGHLQAGGSDIYGHEDPYLNQVIQRNEFGFMPTHWEGEVLAVHPLRDKVIVYGDHGIAALTLAGTTYGYTALKNFGVACRGAVAVSEDVHIFIDGDGNLWALSSDLQMQKLGYRNYLYPMLGKDIVGSHDSVYNRFYFSSTDRTFVFADGLAEVGERISSIAQRADNSIGMSSGMIDNRIVVETAMYDLKMAGLKTCTGAVVGGDLGQSTTLAAGYRHNRTADLQYTSALPVNSTGYAYTLATGSDLNVRFEAPNRNTRRIDYLTLKYKLTDNRHRRGVKTSAS